MSVDNAAVFSQPGAPAPTASKPNAFEVPVEIVSLPSEGLLYPAAHALHQAPHAEIRCMTAREEDLITSSALIRQGLIIPKLLNACVINKSIDVNSLLVGDRNALLIGIRVISYGAEYKARVTCSKCDHAFDSSFMLNQMRIKGLGAEPVTPGVNLFEYQLPISKQRVRFKLMTCGDLVEIGQTEERKRKAKITAESRVTTPLLLLVCAVNGEEEPAKVAQAVLNMRAGDSRALRSYMQKIEPGIDMMQEAQCPACNAASEVDVPIGASFFWPDLD